MHPLGAPGWRLERWKSFWCAQCVTLSFLGSEQSYQERW